MDKQQSGTWHAMIVITENQVERLASYPALIAAMDEVFIAAARSQTENYPFVRSELRDDRGLFGIKSGCNYAMGTLGLKCGGYWNGNAAKQKDRHQSTVLLIDIDTGEPSALVAGNNLTALRTAAAGAAAARKLARQNAQRVGILGTGRQALFQIQALCAVRPIRSVAAWSRSAENVAAFGESVRALGLDFSAAQSPRAAARDADIIVTVTPSRAPLLSIDDVPPGAHINAMGSDTQGKQELSLELMTAAHVWADDVRQAGAIGECQHLPDISPVTAFGNLLIGSAPGRLTEKDITIFDGTGLALQDLAAANLVMEEVARRGEAHTVLL